MTEPSTDRPATALELSMALNMLDLVNTNLRLLNKALFGEESKGPEDQFGQIGAAVANNCRIAEEAIGQFRSRLGAVQNG